MKLKIAVSAVSVDSKHDKSKKAKRFYDYCDSKGLKYIDQDDEYNTAVCIECESSEFYDFLKKLENKFACRTIVNTNENSSYLKRSGCNVEVKLYDDYL